ncbi:lipid A deacylase LpxR family protein [Luteolibacter pohnpeiensis]|uniref:Lipid A deacylase LpxR family protein n=1 Tax=Luteolibacter pohnpeiensis TaxID=454153 RepID=A0A934S8V6_9BACT|nr:lipid A deacylase LpxR family protein [Luteolibacter pohnpeiensis]MBK1883485.1 lipid A deacylase LpxR family protein [Luteolibacter pohnpeiensis]
MIFKKPFLPIAVLSTLTTAVSVSYGDDIPLQRETSVNGGYLTFYLDNDLFAGEDRDYTNGARLSWISPNETADDLGAFQGVLRRFSGDDESFNIFRRITGFQDPDKVRYNYGFSLTQLMYTPEDYEPYTQPVGQRRYAGWLGLGFSLHVKDDRILNSVEFTVGTIGPHSKAEETQDFIHDLRNMEKFNGWDDQVPNEVTADISFVQKRRADFVDIERGWFRMDGLTEWGLRLGTFRTEAYLGGFFRAGFNLPTDFSDPRLSSTAYSHRYFSDGSELYVGNVSIYTLFGATARVVGYDATLDGPVFRSFETGNKREVWVGEVFVGLGVRYRNVEFSYVHTIRTQEYREQDEASNFGTVAIRVMF